MAGFSRADRADDAALLAGLRLGDAVVSAAFIRRFQGAVLGLALSITRDPRAAEDVCQEVFLRAWRAADTYDVRRASVLTWLLTITRNAAIDAVRARRSTPTTDDVLDELLRDTLATAPDLAETAVHRVETERAIARLRRVSPEQARAVVLAVLGGCTAAEVAEREGVPVGTAKTRIRTGLRRLRELAEVDHD
ncbi:RNA polymerase sigma factor [Georgenia sp. H159]|uniref:RNA polymerase sigma factor n=1 Tax=Georgenia sp. H159 TaxID=3076115 RepID=UPI002D76B1AC|nr:sigma-70 family RNA polymerase sigma factor [Georgenia sp. H159]